MVKKKEDSPNYFERFTGDVLKENILEKIKIGREIRASEKYSKIKDVESLESLGDVRDRLMGYILNKKVYDKITGFLGIGSLVFAFYFLAPNFTGNVIGNIDIGSTNLFGSGLFLFGLLNIFVCLKRK